jgi:hypothetical protein
MPVRFWSAAVEVSGTPSPLKSGNPKNDGGLLGFRGPVESRL